MRLSFVRPPRNELTVRRPSDIRGRVKRGRICGSARLGATKHPILIAYWHMFTTGETYNDLGGDYFARRGPERATNASSANFKPSDTTSLPTNRYLNPGAFPISARGSVSGV
jgi:hypothetical protein